MASLIRRHFLFRTDAAATQITLMGGMSVDDLCGSGSGHEHRCQYCQLLPDTPAPAPGGIASVLLPFSAWQQARDIGATPAEALAAAATAATAGAEATAQMTPKLGRASYLGARAVGAPDGGAAAVAIWMTALAATPG